MELLPDALRVQIPALYAQDESPDPIAHLKYISLPTGWIWYVTEFDGNDAFHFQEFFQILGRTHTFLHNLGEGLKGSLEG
jgi:hypothetical protein